MLRLSKRVNKTLLILFVGICALVFVSKIAKTRAIYKATQTQITPQTVPGVTSPTTLKASNTTLLKDPGGRLDWSPSGNDLIAFDRKDTDGYYDIFVMDSTGENEKCITCNNPQLPNRHQGQPAWHPSGAWIVFQAEKKYHVGPSAFANPGIGVFNDLWIISADGTKTFQLTNIPNNANRGILHPHFSRDGSKLVWGEMYEKADTHANKKEFGSWKIKIADFSVVNSKPRLSNIHEYQPGGPVWYETHGFSSDGSTIYFTSNSHETSQFYADIFAYNVASNILTRLTNSGYNEHSQISPDGSHIVWMHTDSHQDGKGTDFWIMNSDGSNKQRLTFFRDRRRSIDYKHLVIAADSSWSPDGTKIAGYVQGTLFNISEKIVMIELSSTSSQ